jgi:hypothetical protein
MYCYGFIQVSRGRKGFSKPSDHGVPQKDRLPLVKSAEVITKFDIQAVN